MWWKRQVNAVMRGPHERGPHGLRRRKYSGDELRAIRAEKGVGRPAFKDAHFFDPHVLGRIRQYRQINLMADRHATPQYRSGILASMRAADEAVR